MLLPAVARFRSETLLLALGFFCASVEALSQAVSVKFRYYPQASYTRVHFPGQFSNAVPSNFWGPNIAGTISEGAPSQADSLEIATGLWVKNYLLPFGTYQYKIYRQLSTTPTNWSWIPDPLNRIVIPPDQNSQFTVDSLVLFQICVYPYEIESSPQGTKFVTKLGVPNLSVGIFRPEGAQPLSVQAFLDETPISNPMNYFDSQTGIFTFKPSVGIPDGTHAFKIAATAGPITKTDSVRFEVRARPVQIQSPAFTTRKPIYITAGIILKPDGTGPDSSITEVIVSVNGNPKTVSASFGRFVDTTAVAEGKNTIRVSSVNGADSIEVTRIVAHAPFGRSHVAFSTPTEITLTAGATTDPDSQTISQSLWFDDPQTPTGLTGKTGMNVTISKPAKSGEYYFTLVVEDPDGNRDTSRNYFIVKQDGGAEDPTIGSNPGWAKRARVYFLFPKAITAAGTINAAASRLQYIRDLGFNVIWMMPVMKNAFPINNGAGPGYNITDFYSVAPEYGTNQDFKNFVVQAHGLGLKVILDVTPNHTSRFHPWSVHAHENKQRSPYWNWYQHSIIPHNDNGLGQSLDADGFNYYSGFSNQLLNYNWTDIDAQATMIAVYTYWVKEFGLDGYRFDVYWGPHRRYGEQFMGKPVRDALKHVKPDILLLAEDDGTGSGTETIYADYISNGINGGVDAAYDFKLYFNQIRNFGFAGTAVDNLHGDVYNGGYFPGPNSLYMRFMESQDEDRIVYFYSNSFAIDATTTFKRTMPMATVIFTVPGFPMIWNGQEVGWGYGIPGSKEARNRSVIDWSYQGKELLVPHYQRLAWIRGTFPAFSTQSDIRLTTSDALVYGFSRPFVDQNGITLVNFGSTSTTVSISLVGTGGSPNVFFTDGAQNNKTYYMNDVYNDTSLAVTFSAGSLNFSTTIAGYGSAVYVLSDSLRKLAVPMITSVEKTDNNPPKTFAMHQNYPNPFNPSTTLSYDLPKEVHVSLRIYNLLGEEVAALVESTQQGGTHVVRWDGRNKHAQLVSSGVYLARLQAGDFANVLKIVLIK